MAIKDSSVETFLEELGSKASTPGGGSAAAVMGGVAAALVSMVCHLTIGKKKYAGVEAELSGVLAKADDLRQRMVDAIDEDVAAFGKVMGAYAMPKQSDAEQAARKQAIQSALREATEAPLACARLCHEAIDLAAIVSDKGNNAVISDGGVAVLAAYAALRSSALNVYVNAKMLDDRSFADAKLRELDALIEHAGQKTETTYEAVTKQLNT